MKQDGLALQNTRPSALVLSTGGIYQAYEISLCLVHLTHLSFPSLKAHLESLSNCAFHEPLRETPAQIACHLFPEDHFYCLLDIFTLFPSAITRYCLKENFCITLLYLALVMKTWREFSKILLATIVTVHFPMSNLASYLGHDTS